MGQAAPLERTKEGGRFGGVFGVACYGPDGSLKWKDNIENMVVTEGLHHILDVLLKNAVTIDPWYIGLTDGSPTPASGDTMSSHTGWTEIQAYDEASRPEFVDGSIGANTANTVDNQASVAVFTLNATVTVGGAFLVADNTIGGTTGPLLCVGAFNGGNKSADSGDKLEVTYEFSANDDGA